MFDLSPSLASMNDAFSSWAMETRYTWIWKDVRTLWRALCLLTRLFCFLFLCLNNMQPTQAASMPSTLFPIWKCFGKCNDLTSDSPISLRVPLSFHVSANPNQTKKIKIQSLCVKEREAFWFHRAGSNMRMGRKNNKMEEEEIGEKHSFSENGQHFHLFFKKKPQILPVVGWFGWKVLIANFWKIKAPVCKVS